MTRSLPEECDVLLRDGGIAHIRLLRVSDRAALHDLVDRSSERSTYLRFACEQRAFSSPSSPRSHERRCAPAAYGRGGRQPGGVTADGEAGELADAVRTVLADPDVDAVLVVYTPPFGSGLTRTQEAIAAASQGADKTVLACVLGHDGLVGSHVPSYAFPEQAVHALSRAVEYAAWRSRPQDRPVEVPPVHAASGRRSSG